MPGRQTLARCGSGVPKRRRGAVAAQLRRPPSCSRMRGRLLLDDFEEVLGMIAEAVAKHKGCKAMECIAGACCVRRSGDVPFSILTQRTTDWQDDSVKSIVNNANRQGALQSV